jgi:hypothetical protein
MNTSTFALGCILVAGSTVSVAATSIPPQFRGTWGNDVAECKQIAEMGTDFVGVVIGGNKLDQPEVYCKLYAVADALTEANRFVGIFQCSSPEGIQKNKIALTLNGGKLQINTGSALRRCK